MCVCVCVISVWLTIHTENFSYGNKFQWKMCGTWYQEYFLFLASENYNQTKRKKCSLFFVGYLMLVCGTFYSVVFHKIEHPWMGGVICTEHYIHVNRKIQDKLYDVLL